MQQERPPRASMTTKGTDSTVVSWLHLGLGEQKRAFVESLGLLLSSGMGVAAALTSVKREASSKRMQRIIAWVAEDVDAGLMLWESLQRHFVLMERDIALVRVGEETGKLHENLRLISTRQQKDHEFRSRLRSAMVYPLIVFTLTAVIGIGIAWFIFPRLATVFATLRVDLPLVTRILIKLGAFLGSYGMVVIPLFACLVVAVCYILFFYARTRFLGEEILLRMPGVGRLLREIELARFGYLLRTLLDAGISLTETLSITAQSSTLTSFQEFYAFLHDRVDEGHSFGRSFAMHPSPSRFIPLPLQQMIISAEQSGHLSETFKIIQDMYEEKVEVTSKNVAVVFEPLLLVIVWFGVLAVALAVILPIYSLIGGLTDR